jgi:hypothetical protein
MTVLERDPVKAYMKRLEAELADLPRGRRREILDEIAEHIAEARAETEADVRNLLDRVGEPDEIAEEARDRFGIKRAKGGALEVGALILLPLGGLLAGVGWVVGVALLWSSRVWSTKEKVIGTLVVPGGLALLPFLILAFGAGLKTCLGDGHHETCTGSFSGVPDGVILAFYLVLLVGPVVSIAYLARQWRRRSG